jgi:hypothetical protein
MAFCDFCVLICPTIEEDPRFLIGALGFGRGERLDHGRNEPFRRCRRNEKGEHPAHAAQLTQPREGGLAPGGRDAVHTRAVGRDRNRNRGGAGGDAG